MNNLVHVVKRLDILDNEVFEVVLVNERFPQMKTIFYVDNNTAKDLAERLV